jgi:hypothetical protein
MWLTIRTLGTAVGMAFIQTPQDETPNPGPPVTPDPSPPDPIPEPGPDPVPPGPDPVIRLRPLRDDEG